MKQNDGYFVIGTVLHHVPFRHWIVDGVFDDSLVIKAFGEVPPAEWDRWEGRYDNDIERGKRTVREVGHAGESLLQVAVKLNSLDFMRLLREWTGITDLERDPTLHGAGLHVMDPASFLQIHLDYDKHLGIHGKRRAVNVIAFLNPEWKPEWGGALLLCDPSGKAQAAVQPKLGRIVVFETNDLSYHGVEQLSPDAPPRVTFASYYLSAARPTSTRTRAMFMPNRNAPGAPKEVEYGVAARIAACARPGCKSGKCRRAADLGQMPQRK